LTRGQINAVHAAFKAGVTPSRIARQFGISQANVRKVLATEETKTWVNGRNWKMGAAQVPSGKVMPKRFTVLSAVAIFISVNAQAQPPEEGRTLWDHNGSVMYLVASGSSREIYYQKPRPGMLEAGAHPDSLLFKGEINDGQISGIAYIFNAQCGQVPFHVKGPVLDNGGKIALTGQAPRVGRSCQTSGEYTSTLEFKLLKTSETAQPPLTTAQTKRRRTNSWTITKRRSRR
jgi:hypothetical protein